MIGVEIGINRLARVGVALPQLVLSSPLALSWSPANGGTATITPPVTSPGPPDLITYTATIDGVPVVISGLTFPAPQGAVAKSLQAVASITVDGFPTRTSSGQYTLDPQTFSIVVENGLVRFIGNRTQINTTPTGAWWQNAA